MGTFVSDDLQSRYLQTIFAASYAGRRLRIFPVNPLLSLATSPAIEQCTGIHHSKTTVKIKGFCKRTEKTPRISFLVQPLVLYHNWKIPSVQTWPWNLLFSAIPFWQCHYRTSVLPPIPKDYTAGCTLSFKLFAAITDDLKNQDVLFSQFYHRTLITQSEKLWNIQIRQCSFKTDI